MDKFKKASLFLTTLLCSSVIQAATSSNDKSNINNLIDFYSNFNSTNSEPVSMILLRPSTGYQSAKSLTAKNRIFKQNLNKLVNNSSKYMEEHPQSMVLISIEGYDFGSEPSFLTKSLDLIYKKIPANYIHVMDLANNNLGSNARLILKYLRKKQFNASGARISLRHNNIEKFSSPIFTKVPHTFLQIDDNPNMTPNAIKSLLKANIGTLTLSLSNKKQIKVISENLHNSKLNHLLLYLTDGLTTDDLIPLFAKLPNSEIRTIGLFNGNFNTYTKINFTNKAAMSLATAIKNSSELQSITIPKAVFTNNSNLSNFLNTISRSNLRYINILDSRLANNKRISIKMFKPLSRMNKLQLVWLSGINFSGSFSNLLKNMHNNVAARAYIIKSTFNGSSVIKKSDISTIRKQLNDGSILLLQITPQPENSLINTLQPVKLKGNNILFRNTSVLSLIVAANGIPNFVKKAESNTQKISSVAHDATEQGDYGVDDYGYFGTIQMMPYLYSYQGSLDATVVYPHAYGLTSIAVAPIQGKNGFNSRMLKQELAAISRYNKQINNININLNEKEILIKNIKISKKNFNKIYQLSNKLNLPIEVNNTQIR